jgi:hypothetical protein
MYNPFGQQSTWLPMSQSIDELAGLERLSWRCFLVAMVGILLVGPFIAGN